MPKYPIVQNLFLLQTGGTIGSTISGSTIDVNAQMHDALITAYQQIAPRPVHFDTCRPFTILSENAVPAHWSEMIDVLKHVNFNDYKGIIVTHGSDTLPYTAAALSYFFASTPIPIVLVCANHPLGHPKSNALPNFRLAVDFILTSGLPGVFAVYQNHDGNTKIHIGTRLLEADWIYDDFESFGSKPFALDDGHCLSRGASTLNPTAEALKQRPHSTDWPSTPVFNNDVLALRAYPGLDYRYVQIKDPAPKAVLHSLYHCGSGNIAGPDTCSLSAFIQDNPQCDHYLISYKHTDGALYASCHELLEAGGRPLKNISFEAALVKLYFAYNQSTISPQAYMEQSLFFEHLNEE